MPVSLPPIGPTDIIDILVVSLIVFQVLMLVRRTRAVQLVIGLGVLFGAYAVSQWLQLYTLQWLLSRVSLLVPIALLILFQPELRRMLEQLGRGGVSLLGLHFAGLDREARIRLVNDVARAARILGSRKIGALIVLERRVGLADFIETGIRIDGIATVQLLINIFFPNTPLHDGAVIIRGDRVVAAGCLLPLTQRPGLSRALGTRHRAALGITEETDAVAVVVSEETGSLSLAREGRISRGLTEEELKVTLLALIGPQARVAPFRVPTLHVPVPVRVPEFWQWARRRSE
ncbi:MAG: TIGR00159 family protein [Armatimonadetes bacterium 13_1_40CM_3_65_7]|nr:MAG: TIGR00159 family protein [Armatimonadetes bacterium 13_1_40CM_3_65_7]